ncbi:MAG TPA: histidine phosphatase family protein [Acidimicrobiia bacterium]|nr:histidine phosphatase family protein [Acidimicrobiia bacterium]
MPRIVLVRHGRPTASYGDDHDPGLDDVGREQAEAASEALASIGPQPILVSPLRRTRETAEPLAARWAATPIVDERVGEIRSPGDVLEERVPWLRTVLASSWPDLPDELRSWREDVLRALRELAEDTVVVTHFVAINVVVGAATADASVVCSTPDFCSRTVVDVQPHHFRLLELGAQAATAVR